MQIVGDRYFLLIFLLIRFGLPVEFEDTCPE